MAIQVSWDKNNQNILEIDTSQKYTWDEFYQLIDEIKAASQNSDKRFDIVFLAGPLPSGNPLPHMSNMIKTLEKMQHLGVIATVVSKQNVFARTIMNIVGQLNIKQRRSFFAETLEEAYEGIAASRQTQA